MLTEVSVCGHLAPSCWAFGEAVHYVHGGAELGCREGERKGLVQNTFQRTLPSDLLPSTNPYLLKVVLPVNNVTGW